MIARWRFTAALALAAALLAPAPVLAAPGVGVAPDPEGIGAGFVPGEVLVKYRSGASAAARASARAAASASVVEPVGTTSLERIHLGNGASVRAAVAALQRRADVEYAQPNYLYRSTATPNDTHYGKQYGLHNTGQSFTVGGTTYSGTPDADIDAPEAWDVATGSSDVVVAVVDTGVDLDHEDLAANLTAGYDWVGDDTDPDDRNGHGTHVAGIIGARSNNGKGVAGVNWKVRIMPLRALNSSGVGSTADIAAAFAYAATNGADIVNASLGAPVSVDIAMRDAILGAPGTLFVVAAGNDGDNVEVQPSYPCVEPAANVICVAATDEDDVIASFSNRGVTSVDLGAPGVNVASTYWLSACYTGYCYSSGTSMAAPFVAGAAALYKSVEPEATVAQIRAALLQRGDAVASLSGKTVTGKRLNLARTIAGVQIDATNGFLRVTEQGDTDTYTIRLRYPPVSDVTVTVTPAAGLSVVSPAGPLTFTAGDWDDPQTVTIASDLADDATFQGPRLFSIDHDVTSGDTLYDGIAVRGVEASVTDYEDVDVSSAPDFSDDDTSIFEPEISWLAAAGITLGCGSGRFCPSKAVTRGQMAAFLTRGLGLPATSVDRFTDDDGSAFEDDVDSLASSGITLGCAAGRFCPSKTVTRGQMAAFLDRALGLAPAVTDFFTDDDGTTFEANINRLRKAEITTGCTAGKFCPGGNVTRGQMAAFLYRSLRP